MEHRVFFGTFPNEIRQIPKRAVEFKASEFLKKSVFLGRHPPLKSQNFEFPPHFTDAFSHVKNLYVFFIKTIKCEKMLKNHT